MITKIFFGVNIFLDRPPKHGGILTKVEDLLLKGGTVSAIHIMAQHFKVGGKRSGGVSRTYEEDQVEKTDSPIIFGIDYCDLFSLVHL